MDSIFWNHIYKKLVTFFLLHREDCVEKMCYSEHLVLLILEIQFLLVVNYLWHIVVAIVENVPLDRDYWLVIILLLSSKGTHVKYMRKVNMPCSITESLKHFPEENNTNAKFLNVPRYPPSNVTLVTVEGCPTFLIVDWMNNENDTAGKRSTYNILSTSAFLSLDICDCFDQLWLFLLLSKLCQIGTDGR